MKSIFFPLLLFLAMSVSAQENPESTPVVSVLYFENISESEEFSWVSQGRGRPSSQRTWG
jgi:hypothetical protein